jgi:molybdopterin-guanine dinucleotide biosynthesis protein
MKLILVGGHTRNIGKTSLVAAIIRAFVDLDWTAIKITQFGHGVCSINGEQCGCATDEHQFAITEEQERDAGTDTARFLAAGARRSLWVRAKQGELASALPALRSAIERDQSVIVESNSLRQFLQPDIYLQVLDPNNADFKLSAQRYFDLADAYIIANADHRQLDNLESAPPWRQVSLAREIKRAKPIFSVSAQTHFISSDVIDFISKKLALAPK